MSIRNKSDVRVSSAYTLFVLGTMKQVRAPVPLEEVGDIVLGIVDEEDGAFLNVSWDLNRFLDLQVPSCPLEVIRKWACRMSAVYVFEDGHCINSA